jgi:hypothetical protein
MPPTDINAANWAKLCAWMEPPPEIPIPPFDYWYRKPSPRGWWVLIPRSAEATFIWQGIEPTLDLCALAEAEIERRELWRKYEDALDLMWLQDESSATEATFMIRLTPAQRCAAMLAAIEAKP